MNERCVFCRIIAGEETVSIIHEDDRVVAFMDIQPYSPGHALVVSREHHTDFFAVPDDLAAHCLAVARRLGAGIKHATGAAALNVFSANGAAGGQDVPHFHLHLIPVREGDHFDLQLPKADAPVPSRSALDVMAARIGRAVQEAHGEDRPRRTKAAAGPVV
ncbi:MAG TPA: HIT family protein [Longimicrobiales bacterium]|nr:HIT family protein [Longimicrobiales bacterium]